MKTVRSTRGMRLVLAAMALVALLPFLAASIPSMTDWAGHVGRYHVMLHADDPVLARFYAFRWHLVGNLGVDLAVRAIGPWLGAERAAWAVTASIPVLTIAGIAAVSRALHGRIQPGAALAACFVLGNPFMFGFINYCLAVALALLVFAAWIALAARPVLVRLALLTPAILLVWVAHAMGWAVLALLVAGFEGEALWRQRRAPAATFGRVLPMVLAFVPPVLLTLLWSEGGAGAMSGYGNALLMRKAMAWIVVLRGGDPVVDIGSTLAILGLAGVLLWRRRVAIDWRLGAGAVLTAVMVLAVPSTIFGSWGADERLAPIVAIAALVALRWQGSARGAMLLAVAGLALFAIRTIPIARDWHAMDARYARNLRALDHVPRGARIFAMVLHSECHAGWRTNAYPHLPSLAIGRADALVDSEWPVAGAPLLRVVYPLPDRLRYDPAQMIDAFDCANRPIPGAAAKAIAALPRDRFDAVWVLDTRGLQPLWPGHAPVYADADSALYALR